MRTLLTRGLVLAAGFAAMLATTAAPAHADTVTKQVSAADVQLTAWPVTTGDRYGYTINVNSGKAIAVLNASTANNASIIQYDMSTALPNNDYMYFEYQGGSNWYRIKPLSSTSPDGNIRKDKCLVVQNASNADNAAIIQYTCTYDDSVNNDVWLAENVYDSSGHWIGDQFRNLKSRKCLVVQNASKSNGAKLIQYNCEAGAGAPYNELWLVSQVTG